MARLGKTTSDLRRFRRRWEGLASAPAFSFKGGVGQPSGRARLSETSAFGSNPGALRMFSYVPKDVSPSAPLVVVLHGCSQNAEAYDASAGWTRLADQHGFAVLYPEQQAANNPKTCFTWFQDGDTARDAGEALSIRQMVAAMVDAHGLDRERVFVTGLSAGGAMASVMLAAYPDVFAGGAIVAGLPYRSASSVHEAFESMFQGRAKTEREWGDMVRDASGHAGPWPKISIWQGTADTTVVPKNAHELVKQWANVHELDLDDVREERVGPALRRAWRGSKGEMVELYEIPGMGHGVPLGPDEPAGPYMLAAGLSSSERTLAFWGLASVAKPKTAAQPSADEPGAAAPLDLAAKRAKSRSGFVGRMGRDEAATERKPRLGVDVQGVITRAFKAAGLIK